MKVIELAELGNPAEVLKVKEVPSRPPGVGEARVRVLAAPIHPANLRQIAGRYGTKLHLPATPGAEGVGEVVELGDSVEQLALGQRVLLTGVGGTWRDELTAPATSLTPAPPGDVEQLAMLTVNPMTAYLLLTRSTPLEEGDWIIQSAANSAVGEMVIQMAALRGIKTVNLVRSRNAFERLEALGGTVSLVDGPYLDDRVSEATNGASIKLALDCVGGETFEGLVDTVGYGAPIVSYGSINVERPRLNLSALTANDNVVRGFWLQKWYERSTPEERQEALSAVVPLISTGRVKTKIDSRFPLEEIRAAVIRAAADGRDGKVMLVPNAKGE